MNFVEKDAGFLLHCALYEFHDNACAAQSLRAKRMLRARSALAPMCTSAWGLEVGVHDFLDESNSGDMCCSRICVSIPWKDSIEAAARHGQPPCTRLQHVVQLDARR